MRTEIVNALRALFVAKQEGHRLNIENYLSRGVGVAEHPDMMESIESELGNMAELEDKIEMLDKHFGE